MSPKFYPNMSTTDLLALRIKQLYRKHEDIHQASEALIKTRLKSKEEFERKYLRRLVTDDYPEGALVLLRNSQIEKSMNRKTRPRYLGPYQVVRRTKGGSYILRQLDEAVFRQGVAAFRLLPYYTRDDPQLQAITGYEPDPDENDSDNESEEGN